MKQVYLLGVFAIGGFLPNFFPIIPAQAYWIPIIFLLLLCLAGRWHYQTRLKHPIYRNCHRQFVLVPYFCCLLLGLTQGLWQSNAMQTRMLAHDLDAKILILSGRVIDLKTRVDGSQKLEVKVDRLAFPSGEEVTEYPRKVLVSWYEREPFSLADKFVAEVKLKRPRGLQNPGLFDYQKWLVAQGFGATGYVRSVSMLERQQGGAHRPSTAMKRWRSEKSQWLENRSELQYKNTHRALALGDGSALESSTWTLLKNTGTVHLLVISGLHVGLIAGFGYFLGFTVGRCMSAFYGINAVRVAILGSLFLATAYAYLSGFGLPAKRALIMILAILLPRYFYLRVSPGWGFMLALAVISIIDQRAVLSAGFWLSFGAVLLLFLGFYGVRRVNFLFGLLRLQALFFLGFGGVLMWQGAAFPLASFFANIIAVPYVSFILVPAEFIALFVSLISLHLSIHLWMACDWLVGVLYDLLSQIVALDMPVLVRDNQWSLAHAIAAFLTLVLFAMPARMRFMPLVVVFLMLLPSRENNYLIKLRVFDVGQGTSILIQQPNYNLVYDTGPKFSENFDSGSGIIAPTLLQKGVTRVQQLVVSHPDSDHRGGLEGLLSEIDVHEVDVGKTLTSVAALPNQRLCQAGMRWRVGAVEYQYLWPFEDQGRSELSGSELSGSKLSGSKLSDNDSSCVLLISFGDVDILLPGDISIASEYRLLKRYPNLKNIDILMVPHHGSKTSSSMRFVRTLNPDIAIVSAGYKNQFRHPHPDVMDRYMAMDTELLNTAYEGAIEIVWRSVDAEPRVTSAADSKKFWWQK